MSKKYTLIISTLGSMAFVVSMYPILLGICAESNRKCWRTLSDSQDYLAIFLPLFFFSLITYKMREEVFRAWWGVAVWMVPIIIFFTLLFNYSGGGGSGVRGAYGDAFAMMVIGLLYVIFIITSLVRIFLAYRRSS